MKKVVRNTLVSNRGGSFMEIIYAVNLFFKHFFIFSYSLFTIEKEGKELIK